MESASSPELIMPFQNPSARGIPPSPTASLHHNGVTIVRDALGRYHSFFVQDVPGEQAKLGLTGSWQGEQCCAHLALVKRSLADIGRPRSIHSATIALSGLIVLADVIVSNADFFPPDYQTLLDEYVEESN